MSIFVAVAAVAFPPFGIPALATLWDARRAAAARDRVGYASALQRARRWALAAFVAFAVAVPATSYLWEKATITCACMSSTFERD